MTPEGLSTELSKMLPLIDMMASEQTDANLHDDAVQEGLIAAWDALIAGKDRKLVHADARRAVANVDRGRPFTGQPRHPGKVDSHQHAVALYRQTSSGEALAVDLADFQAEDALSRVEDFEALRSPLSDLGETDRSLVVLRFYAEKTNAEIGTELGLSSSGVDHRWQKIKRVLADAA